jgi:hypothetical protein
VNNGSQRAEANGNNERNLLIDPAQRLLTYNLPGQPKADTARLLPGEVASEFPANVPLPEDNLLIGSLVQRMHVTVIFDTPMTPDQVTAFYKDRMIADGWTEPEPWPFFGQGGFQPNMMQDFMGTVFCRQATSISLHIGDSPSDSPAREVRLKYDTDPRSSICGQQHRQRRHFAGMFRDVIPNLLAPPKSQQMPRGGSGSSDTHSETTGYLKTDLDLSSVAMHYKDQLRKSGWQEQESADNGPMAWSSYKFKDEDGEDWNGIFYVVEVPKKEGEYTLFLEARMEGGWRE